ncbi:hypothetical protein Ga0466249_000362 [Sporomusaceae bacterium BoRhaA]|uniref:LamG domain-containing protein n=1 Tax=Pelorhabdus rhamnosifermentans TaxID=2772457 RepID=UPI001C060724|nr:LamG-like jellyroll fold domain-containing protein [Pelorhabdus rhamnosifermentans]MBU2699283.1 hypothetical protein [Pelorhabdus rhamnosifermentans]
MAADDKYTVSLLHFDGGITDESGKVWTARGGAAVSTAQSKFGGSSLYLNGTNQYLTTPSSTDFDFGTGDFTVDWWEYRTLSTDQTFIITGTTQTFAFGLCTFNIVRCLLSSNNSAWDIADYKSMGTVILNNWTHYAAVRKGNTFYTFQNGSLISTWTSTLSIANVTGATFIGSGGASYYYQGYIDELRISKGIARWTSDFTPPTAPYSPGTMVNVPTNLVATAGDSQVSLSWAEVTGATGYNVKHATTAGGPYTTVGANVSTSNYVDTAVTNGTTYYYVVTAVNADGESANSNEASATPAKQVTPPSSDGNVLLQVTMIDSSDREFQLSATEIDGFVNWYNHHSSTDTASYSLNKNIGIQGSKEYLAFEKIISFDVMPLTK